MKFSARNIIIFCLVLLGAILVLPRFFPSLSGGNGFVWLIFLLCPLMHIFMMKGMHGGGHDHGGQGNHEGHQGGSHACCGGADKNKHEEEKNK